MQNISTRKFKKFVDDHIKSRDGIRFDDGFLEVFDKDGKPKASYSFWNNEVRKR